VRTCAHGGRARDLPEDVLRTHTTIQNHLCVGSLQQAARSLNDEDGVYVALKVEVTFDVDVRRVGVDARSQWSGFAAKVASKYATKISS
jgi:hypothetical protein